MDVEAFCSWSICLHNSVDLSVRHCQSLCKWHKVYEKLDSRNMRSAGGSYNMRILSRALASLASTSYFSVGHENIMCRKREA